ncbi:hypothetical protein EsHS_00006020 [Epichloe bromicola]
MAAQRPVNESLRLRFRSARNTTGISASVDHVLRPDTTGLRVYDAGGVSAVWEIGNAFLKVKISSSPSMTREHVTLAGVKAIPPSFDIPNLLYHGEWTGRHYLVLSKVPGQTLADAWPTMDEVTKCHYADRVVDICNELGKLQAKHIGGLDGNQLLDPLLIKRGEEEDFSHENLLRVARN